MTEETRTEKSISDELNKLGTQVAEALKAAWESDDRKKIQAEIAEGLQKFGDQVSGSAKKARESDKAKQIMTQAEKIVADVRASNVTGEIRQGLITGLEAINKELGKLLERLETGKPAAPAAPAAPVEPAEPVAPAESVEPPQQA
jgi:molecular chaperone GrpE (heat shock protein)